MANENIKTSVFFDYITSTPPTADIYPPMFFNRRILAVVGIDGVGKSTMVQKLAALDPLKRTRVFQEIRVEAEGGDVMERVTMCNIQRVDLYREIRDWLMEDPLNVAIMDRSFVCTAAYQFNQLTPAHALKAAISYYVTEHMSREDDIPMAQIPGTFLHIGNASDVETAMAITQARGNTDSFEDADREEWYRRQDTFTGIMSIMLSQTNAYSLSMSIDEARDFQDNEEKVTLFFNSVLREIIEDEKETEADVGELEAAIDELASRLAGE